MARVTQRVEFMGCAGGDLGHDQRRMRAHRGGNEHRGSIGAGLPASPVDL